MRRRKKAQASAPLLRFHDHRGEGWNVHTEEVSISVQDERVVFSGYVYDPTSMAFGDGDTNEYDWASVELSPSDFIDGLTRVQLGDTWQQDQIRFSSTSLSVGNSSLHSPGPATASLTNARAALLFLDAHDAVFSTLESARTGTRLPARQIDKVFLQALRQSPEHVARLQPVGLERTLQALLQEAHLSDIHMTPIAGADGLYLVEAQGDERAAMVISVQPDADKKLGLHVVDRINGLRDRNMASKAVIVTRSSFTDDVYHAYAGYQDRMQLVDFDRLIGMLEDAGWTRHHPGFLTLPLADRPRTVAFISYSHTNRDFARWLYNHLHGWGFHCLLDDMDLRAGDVILSAIAQAIGGADAVLLCSSQRALESPWVRAEIKCAMQREHDENKRIIVPLDLDGAFPKIDALPGVPPYMLELRDRLAIDFQSWKAREPSDAGLFKVRKSLEQLGGSAHEAA